MQLRINRVAAMPNRLYAQCKEHCLDCEVKQMNEALEELKKHKKQLHLFAVEPQQRQPPPKIPKDSIPYRPSNATEGD